MGISAEAERNHRAAAAAIGAALRTGGVAMQLGDLISAMVSIQRTAPGYGPAVADEVACQMMIEIVQIVGPRRARELIEVVSKAGAGVDMQ